MGRKVDTTPLAKAPPAPSWLDLEGREHWDSCVPSLVKDKRVCSVDIPILAAACDFWSRYRQAENINIAKTAIGVYEKLMSSFGVTPKARKQMNLERNATSAASGEDDRVDLEEWR